MFLLLFFVTILIIFLIVEFASIAFNLTGLNKDASHFQAISLVTNTGFTTTEAELIVRHRVRRKIAYFLMITFYVSLPLLITLLIMVLSAGVNLDDLLLTVGFIFFYAFFIRNKKVMALIERGIKAILIRYEIVPPSSIEDLFDLKGNYKIVKTIMENTELAGKQVSELKLNNINITILAIERGNNLIRTVRGNDTLEIGDKLILYGNINSIRNVFDSFRPIPDIK